MKSYSPYLAYSDEPGWYGKDPWASMEEDEGGEYILKSNMNTLMEQNEQLTEENVELNWLLEEKTLAIEDLEKKVQQLEQLVGDLRDELMESQLY